jgi:Mrp family chromosome partitioning ATPase
MTRSPEQGFEEPAAFVARQVRRGNLRHFLFTSAHAGEGTTTTVLGIARELHLSHSLRVIALELNSRTNGFMTALSLQHPPAKYTGESSLSVDDLRSTIPGYLLLSLGGSAEGRGLEADSVTLLDSLLKTVGKNFDVVLIDAPPVLDRTEALAASHLVDGVILVVESGRTRVEMLGHIRSLFAREEINLLGSVLTKQKYSIPGWIYRLLFKA